jgi:hypothetical protein
MSKSVSKYKIGKFSWGEIVSVDYRGDVDHEFPEYHYEVKRSGEKYSYWVEEDYIHQICSDGI